MPEYESVKCQEFPQKLYGKPVDFRVFWHPIGTNKPLPGFRVLLPMSVCSGSKSKTQSVQVKIKCLLLSMYYYDASSKFIQFWAAKEDSYGQTILTVLEQPFGMGSMDIRFCRYRYACMEQDLRVEANNATGPVGRVFVRGSPEFSRMEFYTKKDFPMRDYAKLSGNYLALPIFEHRKCVGVLEFLSTASGGFQYVNVKNRLEAVGLQTLSHKHSHPGDCDIVTHSLLISTLYKDVLNFVRIEHEVPLIQLWIPCFCDKTSRFTRLYCRWTGWGNASSCNPFVDDESNPANGWHSVKNGKGLVGRAYSQKKACFLADTSQFSISDYPLVHFTRSRGLTACFAVPVRSLDPRLHDIILEVFLPPQQNSDLGNVGIQLQSFLSALAQNCHRSQAAQFNTSIPFELGPDKEFCVQYSHSDAGNFLYFDVSQKHQTPEAPDQTPGTVNNGDSIVPVLVEGLRQSTDPAEDFEGWLPLNKRKGWYNIRSAAQVQDTDYVEVGTFLNKRAREDANTSSTGAIGKANATVNGEINVIATYNDDTVLFSLNCNSGIEALRMELGDAFQFEDDKYTMKYKYDGGRWINLSRDKDLHFHVQALKAAGQSTMELALFPIS